MNNKQNHWKFYGRDEELDKLVSNIQNGSRIATSIFGRRRIGKTELIHEAIDRIRENSTVDAKKVIYMEIPVSSPSIGEDFREIINNEGLTPVMTDMVKSNGHTDRYFADQLAHLVKKGVVVCLDEFQNIENYNEHIDLISRVKLIQDTNFSTRTGHTGGGIVVAGSHQQNMLKLLNNSQAPLYDRFSDGIHLKQLEIIPLLEMAVDHGWLENPLQFLAMYSAYGGIPGLWEKYKEKERKSHDLHFDNYNNWRERFWRYESLRPFQDMREGFAYKGFVELNEIANDILEVISQHPNGTRISYLYDQINQPREDIDNNLNILENHLQMINGIRMHGGRNINKYRIHDNDTRHQLLVKRKGLDETRIKKFPAQPFLSLIDKESFKNEGLDLERITAEYLGSLGKHWISEYGVQIPDGGPELDVFVWTSYSSYDKHDKIILASCKRSPDKHIWSAKSPDVIFGPFLKSIYDDQGKAQPKEIRSILVSPVFTNDQHCKLQKRGFETLDLPIMASKL